MGLRTHIKYGLAQQIVNKPSAWPRAWLVWVRCPWETCYLREQKINVSEQKKHSIKEGKIQCNFSQWQMLRRDVTVYIAYSLQVPMPFLQWSQFGEHVCSQTGIYPHDVGNTCQSKLWAQPWQLYFHTRMQVIHTLVSKQTNKGKQPSKWKVLSVANSYTIIGLHCPEYTGEDYVIAPNATCAVSSHTVPVSSVAFYSLQSVLKLIKFNPLMKMNNTGYI